MVCCVKDFMRTQPEYVRSHFPTRDSMTYCFKDCNTGREPAAMSRPQSRDLANPPIQPQSGHGAGEPEAHPNYRKSVNLHRAVELEAY